MKTGLTIMFFCCLMFLSCKRADSIEVRSVEISDDWDNAGIYQFISSMTIGCVGDDELVLRNNQGIYHFERKKDEYCLTASLSLDIFGYTSDMASDYDQIFYEDDLVCLTKEIETSKDQNKVMVYEHIYGSDKITQKMCSWDDVRERISHQEIPSLDELQMIDRILEEGNYSLFGNAAKVRADKAGFLLLDSECVDDMSLYQKYGEYDWDTKEICIYELNYGDSVFIGK